jgi:hypothetical protein
VPVVLHGESFLMISVEFEFGNKLLRRIFGRKRGEAIG